MPEITLAQALAHPLMAPRAPRPGYVRYVYTDEELQEIVLRCVLPLSAVEDRRVVLDRLGEMERADRVLDAVRRGYAAQRAVAAALSRVTA